MFSNRSAISPTSRLAAAALAAGALVGFVATARASTVNIQFEGVATANTTDSFSGQQGAYTGDNVGSPTWNLLAGGQGTAGNLLDSSGSATPDAVSYIGNATSGPDYNFQTVPPNELLSGFLQDSTPEAVTLTGLASNGSYQLYLYGQPGQFASWYDGHHRGAAFSITTGTGGPASGSAAYTLQYNSGTQNVFQENTNYVVFNATASSNGTLAISWTQTPAEVTPIGTNGQDGTFNGLQLISAAAASTTPAVSDVTLTVNTVTGDAILVFNNPRAQLWAWNITSKTGGLNYANLTDITNYTSGPHARGANGLDGVYYTYSAGGYYNPGGTWNLGDIITPSDITSGALDFSFSEFDPSSGLGVNFDPGTINYTAVPEPATLGLFALGGLGLLLASRKRKMRV